MTQKMQHFSLKVLTINIHKGFTAFNRRFILPELRDAVRTVSADIVWGSLWPLLVIAATTGSVAYAMFRRNIA